MRKERGASNIYNMPRQHAQRFIGSRGANALLSTMRKKREVRKGRGRAAQHPPCPWALCEQRMGTARLAPEQGCDYACLRMDICYGNYLMSYKIVI